MRLFALGLVHAVAVGLAACATFAAADDAAEAGADGSPSVDAADAAPPYVEIANLKSDDLAGIDANEMFAFVIQHDAGTISAIDLTGSAPVSALNAGAKAPSAVLAFPDNIVWADYGHTSITTVPFMGQPSSTNPNDNYGPSALARAATGEAFLSSTLTTDGGGNVFEWRADRPLVQGVTDFASMGGNVFDVAMTATTAYWTESSRATVWSRPLADPGAVATTRATGESGCESIAADDASVYWTLPPSAVRMRANDAPGSSTVPGADVEHVPFSLAADGSGVYWLTEDGTLRRWARPGQAETLATGFSSKFDDRRVQAIALTERYVVWITTDGRVLRLEK